MEQVIKSTHASAKSESSAVASTSTSAESTSPCIEASIAHVDIEPVATRLCLATIIFSLLILSLSPHQEPRFLLALAFPSTLVMAYALQSPTSPSDRVSPAPSSSSTFSSKSSNYSSSHFSTKRPSSQPSSTSTPPSRSTRRESATNTTCSIAPSRSPTTCLPRKGRGPWPHIHPFDSSNLEAVMAKASIDCDLSWIYAPTWTVAQLKQAAEKAGTELVKERVFGGHVDMDHLGESWAEVRRVGPWRRLPFTSCSAV